MLWFRTLTIGCLLCSLLLTGCSALQPPAMTWPTGVPPRNPAIASEQITLRVWMAADYIDTAPIRDLMRDFQAAYPNITIEPTSGILWEDMTPRVELAVNQGDPPDVAHGHAFALGAQGLAEPLDDLWDDWNAENEFMPGAMEDVLWKGTYYGVPLDINALFTIYNKRLFREARLPEPSRSWTFDDLEVMAPRLTRPDGSQYAVALSASGWAMAGMVQAAGGDLLTERDGKIVATLDDPNVLATLQLHRKLGVEDKEATLPPPIPRQSDHPVTLFQQGKVAMFFSGPWDIARLRDEAPNMMDDVGTAPLPRGDGPTAGGSVQGGGSLFVPRGAPNREAAFEFMKWAVSEPYAMRLALELGRYPVRTALYDNAELQSEPLLQPFYDQLKRARPYKLEAYRGANQTWMATVRTVFEPGTDLQQVLRDAQIKVQREIDEVEVVAKQ
jgi:ABC-type glycerol-3-phosphate transport system substrate-binding protein